MCVKKLRFLYHHLLVEEYISPTPFYSIYPYFLCHWEQRTGGNPKLVDTSENHPVDVRRVLREKVRVRQRRRWPGGDTGTRLRIR